jgi:SP family sugar:H+ symporter-like MFS transporter
VPETPRFHIGKNQHHLALEFFAKYHGNGNTEDELVQFEYKEVCESIEKEREAKAEKWSTILRDPSSRHRLSLAALMTFLTNVSELLNNPWLELIAADVWIVTHLLLL